MPRWCHIFFYFQMQLMTALVNCEVDAYPPRSRVRTLPSDSTRLTALRTEIFSSCNPK